MRYICLISALLLGCTKAESSQLKLSDFTGVWSADPAYGILKERNTYSLSFSDAENAIFKIDDEPFSCPKSEIIETKGLFNFSCFNVDGDERIRLAVGGWKNGRKAVLFGFEYWVGGVADGEIHAGFPVSFNRNDL